MPGMNAHPISLTNPFVVSLFHHALFFNAAAWWGSLTLILLILAAVTGGLLRFNLSEAGKAESSTRRWLRHAFGALWIVDGLLQFQPSMPLGLGSSVVAPAAQGTPSWLHHLMNHGVALWNDHPIAMAVAVAWFQIGIGLALWASNGRLGRVVAAASALYAAGIWLLGNGAGGLFVRGASLLFGWPGATFYYALAGVWLALPGALFDRRFQLVTSRVLAGVLGVAILLQSLPAAGFWHGGPSNALATMTRFMSQVPQPHSLAWLVRHGGDLGAVMGGGLNVALILWLGATAVGLWLAPQRAWRWPVWSLVIGSVVLWIVAQDTAIYGGLATDLSSFIPLAAVGWALRPARERVRRFQPVPRELLASSAAVFAAFGVSMALFATVSGAVALRSAAETTLYVARNGPVSPAGIAARPFTLTDQYGKTYRLGEHRGRAVVLAFLDPRCWTDCPLIAAQLRELRSQLSASAPVDIVAVAADPYHEKLSDLWHFIKKYDLASVKNFYFVTGRLPAVRAVWNTYGISVSMSKTAKMSIHSDYVFIINRRGRLSWIIPDDPISSSPGTASAVTQLRQLLAKEGIS